jgi:(2Fe-2S) ferredoxin
MPKFETTKQLEEYRQRLLAGREAQAPQVLVCGGPGCLPMGSEEVAAAFRQALAERGLEAKVTLKESGCQGLCAKAVKVMLRPQEITYQQVKPEDVPEIVEATLVQGKILDRLCYQDPDGGAKAKKSEIPFYQGQRPLVLGKMDLIDPTSLDDYLAAGGYQALQRIFAQLTPEAVIDTVARSGLRGRGGGGFPTGRKWQFCREAPGEVKYLICNGDEGDPGAFMDRAVMEGDPHAVLEGMIIGGYAIGARQGFIYVRHE